MAVQVEVKESRKIDELLGKVEIELRQKILAKATREAGKIVAKRAKQIVPQPGYPGDDGEKKALRDTIGVVVRKYSDVTLSVTGPQWPAGAHGHLVEKGHKLVAWGRDTGATVPGKEFMAPAVDQTLDQQHRKVLEVVEREVAKASK